MLAIHPLLHQRHLIGIPVSRAGSTGVRASESLLAAEDGLQTARLHFAEDGVGVHGGGVSVQSVLFLQGLLQTIMELDC